jgi:hypothetical protein
MGMVGHPHFGYGGGSTTPLAGLGVAESFSWPPRPNLSNFFFFFFKGFGHGVVESPI